jgi:hypothetical protein
MVYKLVTTSIFVGVASYILSLIFEFDPREIPYLQEMMYASVSLGLYINVTSIEIETFKSNFKTVFCILVIGVPIKIIIPSLILANFLSNNAAVAYLCATVIAQIDPIAAAKTIDSSRMTQKSETIFRVWSSFDDPVTVLFAFYIFFPMNIAAHSFKLSSYFVYFLNSVAICILAYFLYKILKLLTKKRVILQQVKTKIDIFIVVATLGYSIFSGSFLLAATIGLFFRPFNKISTSGINEAENPEKSKQIILDIIFYFSIVLVGSLSAHRNIDWSLGFVLAVSMVATQILVTFLFLKDSLPNMLRIMFGHQNGMTALLLTLALEILLEKTGLEQVSLFSIALPAVIWIAVLYFVTNSLIDLRFASSSQR